MARLMALVSVQAPRDGNEKRIAGNGNEGGNDQETRALFGNELETNHPFSPPNGNERNVRLGQMCVSSFIHGISRQLRFCSVN